jgi:hypothetical protein
VSAKPGRDLFFRVPAGGPDAQVMHVSMKCAAGHAQPTPRRKAAGENRVREGAPGSHPYRVR